MSNHLAIATVTETWKHIVQEALTTIDATLGANVTVGKPSDNIKGNTVNIYLYQVVINEFLRNMDLGSGKKPTIALNLNYLLSFYGNETKQVPQRLLGRVMAAIHARPVLDKNKIEEIIKTTAHINTSDLDQSMEKIKLAPIPFSLEESFKFWSTVKSGFTLSVAYEARVVLIESKIAARGSALPVKG